MGGTKKVDRKNILVLDRIGLVYQNSGQPLEVISSFSLRLYKGEFLVIVGPSGCGKTSLLRIIAGLETPTAGTIMFRGQPVRGPGYERGMVFQAYTSFPWLTVQKNVEFGLKLRGVPARERARIAQRYIELVGMRGFEKTYPKNLSGGQRQRIALARSICNEPDILLMDEPFGALDAQTRWQMQRLLLSISEQLVTSVIFVTHDVEEAVLLADRVLVSTTRPTRVARELHIELNKHDPGLTTSRKFLEYEEQILYLIRGSSYIAAHELP